MRRDMHIKTFLVCCLASLLTNRVHAQGVEQAVNDVENVQTLNFSLSPGSLWDGFRRGFKPLIRSGSYSAPSREEQKEQIDLLHRHLIQGQDYFHFLGNTRLFGHKYGNATYLYQPSGAEKLAGHGAFAYKVTPLGENGVVNVQTVGILDGIEHRILTNLYYDDSAHDEAAGELLRGLFDGPEYSENRENITIDPQANSLYPRLNAAAALLQNAGIPGVTRVSVGRTWIFADHRRSGLSEPIIVINIEASKTGAQGLARDAIYDMVHNFFRDKIDFLPRSENPRFNYSWVEGTAQGIRKGDDAARVFLDHYFRYPAHFMLSRGRQSPYERLQSISAIPIGPDSRNIFEVGVPKGAEVRFFKLEQDYVTGPFGQEKRVSSGGTKTTYVKVWRKRNGAISSSYPEFWGVMLLDEKGRIIKKFETTGHGLNVIP